MDTLYAQMLGYLVQVRTGMILDPNTLHMLASLVIEDRFVDRMRCQVIDGSAINLCMAN